MSGLTLILPRDLGKKGYRLRCRFKIETHPTQEHLDRGAQRAFAMFIRDMAKQGWEYRPQEAVRLRGPFVPVQPVTIRRKRVLSAREMLPLVRQGALCRDQGGTIAQAVPGLEDDDFWEYELAAVFVRDTILTETPDQHEEQEELRHR